MAICAELANLPIPSLPLVKSQLQSWDLGGGLARPTICCWPIIGTPRKANNYKNMVSHPDSPLHPAGCCPQGEVPMEQHPIPLLRLSNQPQHPAGLYSFWFGEHLSRPNTKAEGLVAVGWAGGEGANVKARSRVVTQLSDRRWGRCHRITQPKTLGSAPLSPQQAENV